MSRCRPLSGVLVVAALLAVQHRAAAQGTVLDRIRKAADDAATAGKKAVTAEVNRQINSAVLDAAAEDVADGSFVAVLSPWSTDNAKSVQVARYAGNAFVVTTSAGRQVIICDPKGVLPWQTTFTISNAAVGTPTNKALGSGKSSTTTTSGRGGGASSGIPSSGRGGGASSGPPSSGRGAGTTSGTASTGRGSGANPSPGPSARGTGAPATGTGAGTGRGSGTATPGGRGGGAKSDSGGGSDSSGRGGGSGGSTKAAPAPSADEKEYKVPSPTITIALPANGPKTGVPSTGSVIVANISQEVLGGAAKIRFAQATIPGEKGPQVVDFGVAFKAMVLPAGTAPAGCLAPGGGRATVAGRGAAPGAAAPPARGGGTGVTPTTTPAAGATTAPAFAEGDVLIPKIDNVKLLAAANDSAKVTTSLKVTDEVVDLGDEQNGYVHVQGSNGEGWVRKALLKKK